MVQHTVSTTWFGIGILAILALGLALLGLVVVVTVLLASGGAPAFKRHIKTAALVALLVVPALAVVGGIGMYFSTSVAQDQASMRRKGHSSARKTTVISRKAVSQRSQPAKKAAVPVSLSETSQAEDRPADSPPDEIGALTTATPSASATTAEAPISSSIDNQNAGIVLSGMNSSHRPTDVLRVRETLPNEPEWARNGPLPGDSGVLVPISSQRFATLAEAEEQVTELAAAYVQRFYHDEYPLEGEFTVPGSLIEKYGVNSLVGEEFEKDFGDGVPVKMYRAHLRLDVNSKLRQALHDSWNEQLVTQRLTTLGTGLGMVTIMLATVAGYFRLNELTHGQYGRRLKLAAVALIGAAGLGVLALS
jgi:hypothetical protein